MLHHTSHHLGLMIRSLRALPAPSCQYCQYCRNFHMLAYEYEMFDAKRIYKYCVDPKAIR